MSSPLKLGSNGNSGLQVNINGLTTSQPSTGTQILQGFLGAGLQVASLLALGAITKSQAGAGTAAPTEQEQYMSAMMTPEFVDSQIKKCDEVELECSKEICELTTFLDENVNKKSFDTEIRDAKNGVTDADYTKYTQNLAKRSRLETQLTALESKFIADKTAIANAQATLSKPYKATVGQGEYKVTISEGAISEGCFMDAFNNDCSYPEPPTGDNVTKEEQDKYNKDLIDYNASKAACQTKDGEVHERLEAQKELEKFKAEYGDNLDGAGGSKYAQKKANLEKDLINVNEEINNAENPTDGKNSMAVVKGQVDDINKRKQAYQIQKARYTKMVSTTTTTDGKTTTTQKPVVDTEAATNRLNALVNHQSNITKVRNELRELRNLITQTQETETNINTLDKKDGNFFSRFKLTSWMYKNNKGADARTAYGTKKSTNNTLTILKSQMQAKILEIAKMQAEIAQANGAATK